ncbi:hypothetical protein LCGC14_0360240 [marine sediment metagenome]|uniref:DNA-directed DNA polymerase family A palm domain-containing protein n=1 Tax=marine sediment metagenome TaxID=412755 RepID=A0A0F9T8D2_9ZZZZ
MSYQEILKSVGYPEKVLIIDFESYYDQDYSLGKKMSIIEYITDPRFDFTGVGTAESPDFVPRFCPKSQGDLVFIYDHIACVQNVYGLNLERCTVVAKNCKFDMAILAVRFGIIPPYVIDIDDLLRHYDARMSHRMKDVTKMFGLKDKGKTIQFKGLHYEDMDAETNNNLKNNLADYCCNDIEIETALFQLLLPEMSNPQVEIPVARHTLDLYLRPKIKFDFKKATDLKLKMLVEVKQIVDKTEHKDKDLSGNLSFVKLLQEALPEDEQIPVKVGKPGKNMTKLLGTPGVIPAFAKDDRGFQELLVHPDKTIRNLCVARQAVKSWPLHIKRINNMANQATASGGLLRVPLNYYGAHTGRWSGSGGINLQNLGGRGRGGQGTHPLIAAMRSLLGCPDGVILGIADSAQIEARILAWFANQEDLVNGFANGEDIYSVFATMLFNSAVYKPKEDEIPPVKKLLKIRRGFGKDAILGCVALGTPVLTYSGWKSIEDLDILDKLWDGRQWVNHKGVVHKGKKSCVNVKGIWVTPDHEILDKGVWFPAISLSTGNQFSETCMENLKLSKLSLGHARALSPSNVVAPVVKSLLQKEIAWSPEILHVVMSVLKRHPVKLRLIKQQCLYHIKNDCLIEFVQLLADARPDLIDIMVNEVLECGPNGSLIELIFLNIWQHCQGGIIRSLILTESIIMLDTDQVILDSPPGSKILETADILYSGDYHRFQAGNMIVSNCGYGMGTNKFYENCVTNSDLRPLFDSGEYDWDFIDQLIKTYRTTYKQIPEFWSAVEKAFKFVIKYPHEQTQVSRKYDEGGNAIGFRLKIFNRKGTVHLQLPSGRELTYRHCSLKQTTRGSQIRWHYGHLWGGSITENIVQACARDLLAYWILEIDAIKLPIVLHSHDEIVCMLQKNDVGALDDMLKIMCTGPEWAVGLPLDAEGELSEVYKK